MLTKHICLGFLLKLLVVDAYSVSGPKNQPEDKALKFRSPPAIRSDAPNRPLPNKASWLPASLTTPKSNQMMNPLQNRSTSLSQNRAVASRLFFSPDTKRNMSASSKTSPVGGRLNLSLFSSLGETVEKINRRNYNKSVARQVNSILSQRKANAKLGSLLKLATVFEDTICTEERMAAIRSEFDISDDKKLSKGLKISTLNEILKSDTKTDLAALESKQRRRFRFPLIGRIFSGKTASHGKETNTSITTKNMAISPSPSVTGQYLTSLSTQVPVFGTGMMNHLDSLTVPTTTLASGSGFSGYLDSLSVNTLTSSATSGNAFCGYLATL